MPTPDITAGSIMDSVASLMNDTAKSKYTYVKQLPYLKMALKELRETLELNDSPVVQEVSTIITIPAGIISIGFDTVPYALPSDLVDIVELWESAAGINSYSLLDRQKSIPVSLTGVPAVQFGIWAWESNKIRVPAATGIIDLRVDYIKSLFTSVIDENSTLGVINAESFLTYRTAGLCAEFIGENPTRAASLNTQSVFAIDRTTGIENKGKQAISVRRRPFRSRYKSRR